jgi:hypothetical protein
MIVASQRRSSRDSVITHRIFRQVSNTVLVASHQRIASAIQQNNSIHTLLPAQSRITHHSLNVEVESPANLAVQV